MISSQFSPALLNQTCNLTSRIRAALTLLLISTTLPAAAQDISKLAWLAGTWTQSKAGSVVQESWLGPRGNMLAAVSLTTSEKGKASFEHMRIVETSDGLIFYASPGGAPATAFTLKSLSGQRVVFENLANDFPHRVIYQLDAAGELHARIEGDIGGKARAMEWHFKPAK